MKGRDQERKKGGREEGGRVTGGKKTRRREKDREGARRGIAEGRQGGEGGQSNLQDAALLLLCFQERRRRLLGLLLDATGLTQGPQEGATAGLGPGGEEEKGEGA